MVCLGSSNYLVCGFRDPEFSSSSQTVESFYSRALWLLGQYQRFTGDYIISRRNLVRVSISIAIFVNESQMVEIVLYANMQLSCKGGERDDLSTKQASCSGAGPISLALLSIMIPGAGFIASTDVHCRNMFHCVNAISARQKIIKPARIYISLA